VLRGLAGQRRRAANEDAYWISRRDRWCLSERAPGACVLSRERTRGAPVIDREPAAGRCPSAAR